MTHMPSAPLTQSIMRLLSEIDKKTADLKIEINPEQLDRLARSISIHLKALSDLDAYNQKTAQLADNEKYTAYEDLPPPSPADRKRFEHRIAALIGQIESGGEIPDIHPRLEEDT